MTNEPNKMLKLQSDILWHCQDMLDSFGFNQKYFELKVETMRIIGELNRKIYSK